MVEPNQLVYGRCYYRFGKWTENDELMLWIRSYVYLGERVKDGGEQIRYYFQDLQNFSPDSKGLFEDRSVIDEIEGILISTGDNLRFFYALDDLPGELKLIHELQKNTKDMDQE